MTLLTNESSSSSSLIPTKWSTTSPPRMAITVGTADTWRETKLQLVRRVRRNIMTWHAIYRELSLQSMPLEQSWINIFKTALYTNKTQCLDGTSNAVRLTPYSIAKSVWSSMSTFAMATRPFCFATAFSNLGPRILQGPHQLKKDTHNQRQCVVEKTQVWGVCEHMLLKIFKHRGKQFKCIWQFNQSLIKQNNKELWYVFGKQQDFFDEVYKVWNKKERLNERPFYSWNVDRSAQLLLLKLIMALFYSRVPVCHDSEPACTIPKFSIHSIF